MIAEIIGLKALVGVLNDINEAITKKTETMLEELSYEAEVIAKNNVPVWSGQLWSSIGNKASTKGYSVKMPASKYLDTRRQAKGRGEAIWTKKKMGRDIEIQMGTRTSYANPREDGPALAVQENQQNEGRGAEYMGRAASQISERIERVFDEKVWAHLYRQW